MIEDDQGDRVYKVDGEALRVSDTFLMKDRDGKRGGEHPGDATAPHGVLVGILHRFDIDIERRDDLSARSNVVDDEYEVKRDGEVIATLSRSGCACATPMASRSDTVRTTTALGPGRRDRQDEPELSLYMEESSTSLGTPQRAS